eukprot:gnl/TRDRNA2_/TRDRNA2_37509_c0_seq1.p1 gnl/TRDRNA2_/TRDRNA2_37509_c0~~gnl/TRDRNA2_/TRDRNA2_37509_c0_seq1.p1  ORF type:complete len:281 (+),score=82.32 gnl/TRDRNA2_/TRDRNA2_37509_c0_seq1:97-939(+)
MVYFYLLTVFFLAHASMVATHRVSRHNPKHRELRKGKAKAFAQKDVTSEIPLALAVIGDKCKCKFIGHCTCRQAIQFMDCISDACASGECDCHKSQFQLSCHEMAGACSSIGLACTEDKATCTHMPVYADETKEEILDDLADLKERKCKLEEAQRRGYLNADNRLRDLRPKIQGAKDMLKKKDAAAAPNMDCDKPMLAGEFDGVKKTKKEHAKEEKQKAEDKEEEEVAQQKSTLEGDVPEGGESDPLETSSPMQGYRTAICIFVIAGCIAGIIVMMALVK